MTSRYKINVYLRKSSFTGCTVYLLESSRLAKVLPLSRSVPLLFLEGESPFYVRCGPWEKKRAWVCLRARGILTGAWSQLGSDINCPDLMAACDAACSLSLLPYPLQGFLKCSIWILVSGKDPALGPIWQMRSCAASAPADRASPSQSRSLLVSSYCCETSFSSLSLRKFHLLINRLQAVSSFFPLC